MPKDEDLALARLILGKKWLSKETLTQALQEVEKIRLHDKKITLADYLGVKEILPWEKIQWAQKALRAAQASPGGKKARPSGGGKKRLGPRTGKPASRAVSSGRRVSRKVPAGPAEGRHEKGRHVARRKKQSATPAAVALGVGVVVLAVVLIVVLTGRGSSSSPQAPGTATERAGASYEEQLAFKGVMRSGLEPAEKCKRAEDFLSRFPQSAYAPQVRGVLKEARAEAQSHAQAAYELLQRQFPQYFEEHKFTELMQNLRAFAKKYRGTEAAARAASAVDMVQRRWSQAVSEKLDEIDFLVSAKNYQKALQEARALLAWCGSRRAALVELKISEVEKKRAEPAVASTAGTAEAEPEKESSTGEDVVVAGTDDLFGPSEEQAGPEQPTEPSEPKKGTTPSTGTTSQSSDLTKGAKTASSDDYSDLFGSDASEDLFGEAVSVKKTQSKEKHPLVLAIERQGKDTVMKELRKIYECSAIAVDDDGKVHLGYDFFSREERLARDWKPKITKSRSARLRWSLDWEGDLQTVFYGVRVSEQGYLLGDARFKDQFEIELCYHSAQLTKPATHLIVGFYQEEKKTWYGTDFGAAVRTDSRGKVREMKGRRERPEAMVVRWYRASFQGGKLSTALALAGGRGQWIRYRPRFRSSITYRPTGQMAVPAKLTGLRPGFLFYGNLVGTVGYIRLSGYPDPEWLKEQVASRGADLDLDVVTLDEGI